ncbi:MAG: DUF3604 domain-containing protein [Actinomycetota bacterium]|nr:DUF3604 domain-containing protein [Actinomycetota bacterium]
MVHECDGADHRLEAYALADRRLLEEVEAFNRELVAGFAGGLDLTATLAALDPDPARYTWVDEGGGIVGEILAGARQVLAGAPRLAGFARLGSALLPSSAPAARPAVAAGPGGSLLVAWVEWIAGRGEVVKALRLDAQGSPTEEAQVVSAAMGDCLRPSVAFDGDGAAWVAFGWRKEGPVAVHVACAAPGGRFGPPEPVGTCDGPAFNQELTRLADGSLEMCWQAWSGGRFQVVSRRRAGRAEPGGPGSGWGPVEQLSEPGERNVWDPTVAAEPAGGSAYAWTTYGEAGYRTRVLRRTAGGSELRTTLEPAGAYSLHPSLAFGPDGDLWCATDQVTLGGHGGSGPTRLRATEELGSPRRTGFRPDGRAVPADLAPEVDAEVVVLRIGDGAPTPTGRVGAGMAVSPAGLPRLAVTGAGHLAVAYRCLRRLPLMLYYWDTVVEWLGPGGWCAPTTFDEADGPLEEPGLVAAGDGVVACWQEDGRRDRELTWTEGFGGEECLARRDHYGEVVWHTLHTGGRVRLGVLADAAGPAARSRAEVPAAREVGGEARAAATSTPGTPISSGASSTSGAPRTSGDARPWARARRARQAPERYTTTVGGRSLSLYWGDLHRHSLVSRCTAGDEPELDDFYRYAFDVCEYDFWAVTDHAENTSSYQWWSIQKLADVLHVPGRFVPFYGFEWTSATGHQNVIYESSLRGAPIYSSTAAGSSTPAELWAHLRRAGQRSLTIPHHPGSAMVPFDWSYRDEEMLRLVEVFQACRGNYEDDGCHRQFSDATLRGTFVGDGLRAGHRFGLIGSSDHGNGAGYVGVFAESLTREAVFDALAARATMAATTRDVVLDVRLEDTFMGGVAAPAEVAGLRVHAEAYGELARIEVVTQSGLADGLAAAVPLSAGELAVPLRVEWSTGDLPLTDWSGQLGIQGGSILPTRFWSPEIVAVSANRIDWQATTRNFRSQYGAQRGGVELTAIGRPDATVEVATASGGGRVVLGDLARAFADGPAGRPGSVELARGPQGTLRLQAGTGGLTGLGTDRIDASFELEIDRPSWVYVRATLVDGEMAWSSPIWVDPAEAPAPG